MKRSAASVDAYIRAFPPPTAAVLRALRAALRKAAPHATETISYLMPTLEWHGHLVHYAGYAKHVSVYGIASATGALGAKLKRFASGRGTLRFELGWPLPLALIAQAVRLKARSRGRPTGSRARTGRRTAARSARR
jgi:uncharacterized protein YdhG (YjbR/CyaY superfamily)